MDDAINRVTCQEQKALMTEFFESYQAAFPDSTPLAALALVFSIDMKTWKFPEAFHSGSIAPQIEFIENSEALRKLMIAGAEYNTTDNKLKNTDISAEKDVKEGQIVKTVCSKCNTSRKNSREKHSV